jgi:hypothetical protein
VTVRHSRAAAFLVIWLAAAPARAAAGGGEPARAAARGGEPALAETLLPEPPTPTTLAPGRTLPAIPPALPPPPAAPEPAPAPAAPPSPDTVSHATAAGAAGVDAPGALPAPSLASPAAKAPPLCGGVPRDSPPDPRCNETLDGRPDLPPAPDLGVARAALWLPRQTSNALFWPVVEVSDLVEEHHVPGWMQAIFTTDDGLVGIMPQLAYATGFLPTVGARAFFKRFPAPGSEVAARFLTGGPSVILAQLQLRGPSWTGLALDAAFDRRHDRLFAGLGPQTETELDARGEELARYGSDILDAHLRWSRRIDRRLLAIVHGDIQRREYESNDIRGGPSVADVFNLSPAGCAAIGVLAPCVDPAQMPGFYQGLKLARLGATFIVDTRGRLHDDGPPRTTVGVGSFPISDLASHGRDSSGVTATVDGSFGHGVAGDPTSEGRLLGVVVGALGGTDRQLLLRLQAAMVQPLTTAPIPFDELISPTGNLGLRGYPDGRLRGESGTVASLEYRYYIASVVDASVFTDVGTVAGPAFAGLFQNHWFPDVGLGLRFYSAEVPHWQAVARGGVQVTWAPDAGFRVLLALAPF